MMALSRINSLWLSDAAYVEYNDEATIDNGTCLNIAVYGCVYIFANNYNPAANVDDGSCDFDIFGCMDMSANNYNLDS